MRLLVVVPAFNEATTIREVVRAVPAGCDVVVVDDASDDATADEAARAGARVLYHAVNRGLGGALRTGFLFAQREAYEGVITIDGDGQHDPREIPRFVHALAQGNDLVIGVRDVRDMPRLRQWYNRVGRLITHMLLGAAHTDTESGFRALSVRALQQMQLTASRMEISSEIVAEAQRAAMRVGEVPITVRYTNYSLGKGQSFVEGTRTAWRLLLKSMARLFI